MWKTGCRWWLLSVFTSPLAWPYTKPPCRGMVGVNCCCFESNPVSLFLLLALGPEHPPPNRGITGYIADAATKIGGVLNG